RRQGRSSPQARRPKHGHGAGARQAEPDSQSERRRAASTAESNRATRAADAGTAATGDLNMPKMKTHRGAAKRFKVTGSGKIMRRKAFRNHILEKKPSKRTRRLAREAELTGGDRDQVRRLLGL